MPDVSSAAPAEVSTWVAIDQHKLSLVAAILPASGGQPEVVRLDNTERAIRRFIARLGEPERLAVAYEAGPGGYELHRLLSSMSVGCDVIAPSLVPVRAGDSWASQFGTNNGSHKRSESLPNCRKLRIVLPTPSHRISRCLTAIS